MVSGPIEACLEFKVAIIEGSQELDRLGPSSNPESVKWLDVYRDLDPLEAYNLEYNDYLTQDDYMVVELLLTLYLHF